MKTDHADMICDVCAYRIFSEKRFKSLYSFQVTKYDDDDDDTLSMLMMMMIP